MKTTFFALLACMAFATACGGGGSKKKKTEAEPEAATGSVAAVGGGVSTAGSVKLMVPIDVSSGDLGLLGTAATAYSVDLASCLSGYSDTVTQANADGIEVYKGDRNCLAKLTAFTTGGVVYNTTNAGASNFTTWLANDTALFASAAGAIIRVKVIAQLSSPIAGTEPVTYTFSELRDATSDIVYSESQVSDAHLITVSSQEAPLFKLVSSTYAGVDAVTGAPKFTFKLECVDDPSLASPVSVGMSAGSAANTLCGTNDLNTVTYKLVKDTYSSVISITNAETIFSSAGTGVTIPGDQYAIDATHEGFSTVALNGPGGLGTPGNEHMILVVRAGLSYTYYNVDVTTVVQ